MATKHLLIKGEVQGVFYRVTAKENADKIGVKGWVKNTDAGDVEAVVNGPEEKIEEFIAWCRRGPRSAKVDDIEISAVQEEDFSDFKIIR